PDDVVHRRGKLLRTARATGVLFEMRPRGLASGSQRLPAKPHDSRLIQTAAPSFRKRVKGRLKCLAIYQCLVHIRVDPILTAIVPANEQDIGQLSPQAAKTQSAAIYNRHKM